MKKTLVILVFLLFLTSLAFGSYVEIGTGTSTNYYVPFYGYYDYGWSKVIYLQSEIGSAIDINKISYDVSNTPSGYTMTDQRIYMKHTSDIEFASGDYEDVSTYTEVYNGPITWDGTGWNDITLDTPFSYNGTDNLIVYYQNHRGDYASGYPNWRYTSQTNRAVYKYQDNSFPEVSGTRTYRAVNIRLHYHQAGAPYEPTNPDPANGEADVASSGNLTWDFGADTDTYDLWFGLAGNMVEVVTGAAAGASGSYAYSNLNSGAGYEWQVIAHNSAKLTTNGPVWNFSAECTSVTLPYTENFDSATPPDLPNCWSKINDTGSTYPYVETASGTSTTYYHSAPNYLKMYNSSSTTGNLIAVSPQYSGTVNGTRIKFWAKASTGTNNIIVGTMTDPMDAGTFTPIQTVPLTVDYTEFIVGLGSGTDEYFAIKHGMDATYDYNYLDDFTWEELPSVPEIGLSDTFHDFGYVEDGTSASWDVTINNNGAADLIVSGATVGAPFSCSYSGTISAGDSDNATIYFNPAKASFIDTLVFHSNATCCDSEIVLTGKSYPAGYTFESFENDFPPSGWQIQNIVGNDWVQYTTSTAPDGGKVARLYYTSTTGAQSRLVTPKLNIANVTDFLMFTARYYSAGTLTIQYSTDATSWTDLEVVPITTTFEQYTVDLSSIAGKGNYYLGFLGETGTSYSYIYLDAVFYPPRHWEAPGTPANPSPADLATGQLLTGPLDWDDCDYTQTYDVYLENVNPPTVKIADDITISEAAYNVPDFGSTYYWQVVAKNPGAKFETPGPVWSFTTLDACPGLPLTEDFEHGFNNFGNAAGNDVDWIMNDTLFVSSSHSAWNPYEASNDNILMQTCVLDLTAKVNAILKFWHIAKTEGYYDECYVEISTDAGATWAVLPAATYLGSSLEYAGDECFWEDSYPEWGTSTEIPTNTWWKQELFNLTSYNTFDQVMIRFRLSSDSSGQRFGWLIDNVSIEEITPEPDPPSAPYPQDDAVAVSITPQLSWVNGFQTETIDLYFSPDSNLVNAMVAGVQVIADQDTNAYSPGMLNYNTTYFWKVKAKNSNKAETAGPLWRFTTEEPPAPENLTATATDAQIDLEWQEPLPTGEIKYDDGTAESWYWVADPSSLDDYFYVKFNAPANGNVTHIAVFNASNGAGWNEIMICLEDSIGNPDLASPYQSFPNIPVTSTISQGGEWEVLELTIPKGVSVGETFFVVTHWPDASSTGPFVGTDTGASAGRSYWTNNAGVTWTASSYNYIMRAYMTTAKGEIVALTTEPSTKASGIPVFAENDRPESQQAQEISMSHRRINNTIATSYNVPRIIVTTSAKNRTITGYKLYRGTASGVYSYLAFVGAATYAYTDNAVSNMNEYFYVVSAIYDIGESGYSNEASGVPMAAATVPYFSNFDAKDNGGFYGTGDWENGAPTYVDGPTAYTAPNVWGTKLDTTYSANSNSWLIQPFDLSAKSGYKVNFFHWDSIETDWDYGYVAVDHDNDNLYTLLATYTGYQTTWTEEQVIIPDSLCSAYTKLAFIFTSDGSGEYPGFYIDNVGIDGYIPAQIDVDPVLFSKSLLQNGSTTDNLMIGNVTRATQEDLVYTASVSGAGGTEDFEASDGGYTSGGTNNSWEWGTPAYVDGPATAHSGTKCWGTNMTGDFNDYEYSHVQSIPFDLSTAVDPELVYYHWFDMGGTCFDGVNLKVSNDGGTTWTLITPDGGYTCGPCTNLDNEWVFSGYGTGTWDEVRFDLSSYVGDTIIIRWRLGTSTVVPNPGYYLDDVQITGLPQSTWLTLDGGTSVNGSIPVGDSDDITVGFDATGLAADTYNAEIVITSNDPDNPSVTVPVTLEVAGPPAIDILVIDDGANVKLTWTDEGYTYKVYSSTDPHAAFPGGWTYVTSVSGVGEVTLPAPAANTFYVVTASDDPPLARPANKVKANNNR